LVTQVNLDKCITLAYAAVAFGWNREDAGIKCSRGRNAFTWLGAPL